MSDKFVMVPPSINVCASTFPWVAFDDVAIGDVVMQKDGTVGQKMFAPPPHRMIRKDNGQEFPLGPFESHVYVLFSPTKKGTPTIEEKIRRTINETLLSEDFRKSFTKRLAQDILDAKSKAEAKAEAKPTKVPEPGEDFRLLEVGEIIREGDEYYKVHSEWWQACAAGGFRNNGYHAYRRRTHIWRTPTHADLANGPIQARVRDDGNLGRWQDRALLYILPEEKPFRYICQAVGGGSSNYKTTPWRFCEIRVPVE